MEQLRAQLDPAVPLWAVDTACVVPMRLTKKAYERAGPYRSSTEGLRRLRARALYRPTGPAAAPVPPAASPAAAASPGASCNTASIDCNVGGSSSGSSAAASSSSGHQPAITIPPGLGWQPFDLTTADIPALVAAWPGLDHSVPGVAHVMGGSRAGYARWEAWKATGGLSLYAARRNDAMQREGTSRLSPYHHFGACCLQQRGPLPVWATSICLLFLAVCCALAVHCAACVP